MSLFGLIPRFSYCTSTALTHCEMECGMLHLFSSFSDILVVIYLYQLVSLVKKVFRGYNDANSFHGRIFMINPDKTKQSKQKHIENT